MADGSHSSFVAAPSRRPRIAWTAEAVERLREAWERGGLPAAREAFPGASDGALGVRASFYRFRSPRSWTRAERATVRELYPQVGPRGVCAVLPHRSYAAVTACADALGIRYDAHWWTPEQQQLVSDAYARGGRAAVRALGLQRTIGAARQMALLPSARCWSASEIRTLRQAWQSRGAAAAYTALAHRSRSAVKAKARELKLRQPHTKPRWDRVDIDMLRAMYPQRGPAGCAAAMTWRSRRAIYAKAAELGLQRAPATVTA